MYSNGSECLSKQIARHYVLIGSVPCGGCMNRASERASECEVPPVQNHGNTGVERRNNNKESLR